MFASTPTVYLAALQAGITRETFPPPPTVRLACIRSIGFPALPDRPAKISGATVPALLVSYAYTDAFMRNRHRFLYRNWAIDSGAYTASVSGVDIRIADYIRFVRDLTWNDPTLAEIFALDVIGDWKASARNTELMWKAGIEAIPAYHYGEPFDVLKGLARDYPKIAIGGLARGHGPVKLEWARKCLETVWPKKVHGFGFGGRNHAVALPFHSTDASDWEFGPLAYGAWNQFDRTNLGVRGEENHNLIGEINVFMEVEAKARARWKREMAELEAAAWTGRLSA